MCSFKREGGRERRRRRRRRRRRYIEIEGERERGGGGRERERGGGGGEREREGERVMGWRNKGRGNFSRPRIFSSLKVIETTSINSRYSPSVTLIYCLSVEKNKL